MSKPLLVLVTGEPVPAVQTERGDFPELIRDVVGNAWPGDWSVIDARALAPEVSHAWAGVIITGSPASLTERAPWMDPALMYVRHLVGSGTPTLGICFGHQMLGEALGGRVERNPAGREIGTVSLMVHEPTPLLPFEEGQQRQLAVNMTHLDSVVRLPEGAQVLARTSLEPHAFVRFAPEAWGVQFHPEMDAGVIRRYIEHRGSDLADEGLQVDDLLTGVGETPESHSLLRRFAEHVARRRA